MASSTLPLFFLLLVSTAAAGKSPGACADPPPSTAGATELSIFHVDSHCSSFSPQPTPPSPGFDSVQAQARKDPARLAYLSSLVATTAAGPRPTTVPVASGQQVMQSANYVLRAKIGTPGQLLYMALDTSADAAWVPCAGCTGCPSSTAAFTPSASTTYTAATCSSSWCPHFKGPSCPAETPALPCVYNQSYGGDIFTAAVIQDSLRLALDIAQGYAFGCVNSVAAGAGGGSMPKQGLLGLGRGPASLLSQTGSLYGGVFSYCLPSFKSYYFSGSLRLGATGQPQRIRTTPLLANPHRPSLYYVNLTGVSVGKVAVAAPAGSFAFDQQTGAGTVVDSGTVITRFVAGAYEALRDEFRRQVAAPAGYTSLGAFDTCFDGTTAEAPPVTLHFEGMDLVLPVENTLIHSSSTPLTCLAMAAAPVNVNAVVNVIANLQQQNHRVLFDVANSRVGFARELCN